MDSDSKKNRGKNYRIPSHKLFTPTLEDLKNVLFTLNPFFEEFEIAVVSCPNLTRAPYNFAAAGLSGNTGISQTGCLVTDRSLQQAYFDEYTNNTNYTTNKRRREPKADYSICVIESDEVAKPFITSYNGRLLYNLTIKDVIKANRNDVNNGYIIYEDASIGQIRLKIMDDPNAVQLRCLMQSFFFSEGKQGPVIKMRAKGLRSMYNIIALIQGTLNARCQDPLLGLGIVLVINTKTRSEQFKADVYMLRENDIYREIHHLLIKKQNNWTDFILLGALTSDESIAYKDSNGKMCIGRFMFNTFCNSNDFFNDDTPLCTEYIAYINIAQESCF